MTDFKMTENEDFITFFKKPVLLASFGGLPVPGAEKLLFAKNIFKIIFRYLFACAIILLMTEYFDATCIALKDNYAKHYLLAGVNWILFGVLKSSYMVIKRKEWSDLIKQWDTSFRTVLFPNMRRIELEDSKKMVWTFVKWEYILLLTPVLIWASAPTVTGKTALPSCLVWDHDNSPTFEVMVLLQIVYGYFLATLWSANDSFLMIYTSLIAAELRYLSLSLNKILSSLRAIDNGIIYADKTAIGDLNDERKINSHLYEKKIKEIKSQLKNWIHHHAELLSFISRLQRFYSPLILLQYVFIVGFCCLMLIFSATGKIPPTYAMVGLCVPPSFGMILYIMCWFGEKISTQNELLSLEVFQHDWFLLPKDVQYALRFILIRTQRRVGLSAYSLMPLNVKSFEQMAKFGYSFYMFIKQVNE